MEGMEAVVILQNIHMKVDMLSLEDKVLYVDVSIGLKESFMQQNMLLFVLLRLSQIQGSCISSLQMKILIDTNLKEHSQDYL